MNSRMERYSNSVATVGRTEKNRKLYDKVQDMNIDYIDINVDNVVELDMNKPRRQTRSDYQQLRELGQLMPREVTSDALDEVLDIEKKEPKVYDINEILKLARENKLFQDSEDRKRLINTEYNILTKLDINELEKKEEFSKESLRKLIDEIYDKEKKYEKKPIRRTRSDDKDLFADLSTGDFEVSEDISGKILEKEEEKTEFHKEKTKELSKTNVETDLYTKIDNETLEHENTSENTQTEDLDLIDDFKSSKFVLIFVIIVVLGLLGVGGFIFYKYFM